MALGDKIGDQTIKDLTTGVKSNIETLLDGLHELLDGATLKVVDGGVQLNLRPRVPAP